MFLVEGCSQACLESADVVGFVTHVTHIYSELISRTIAVGLAEGRAIETIMPNSDISDATKVALRGVFNDKDIAAGVPDVPLAALLGPRAFCHDSPQVGRGSWMDCAWSRGMVAVRS